MLGTEQSFSDHVGQREHQSVNLSDDEKWHAALSRDETFDGLFVFAVRSTGIYCRPSCPSKRAARERVSFFPGSMEAENAGFRACHRCQPREAGPSPRSRMIDQICKYIEANLNRKLTLAVLGEQVGMSPYHLQRTFKRVLGVSPRQYVASCRLAKMKAHLRNRETVNDSLYHSGFSSRSRVYEDVPGVFGVNPGEFRRGGKGLRINYGIVDSNIGRLLVAATERGVCSVCIGDNYEAVENSLVEDFPSASLFRDDDGMKAWTDALVSYVNGERPSVDLPVQVRATAFQSKVWKMIRAIPYGKTSTYSQIARQLGMPSASRAVARACATNPIALVIPCHRVVGKHGSLRGYRWGIQRKQALLNLEKERLREKHNSKIVDSPSSASD